MRTEECDRERARTADGGEFERQRPHPHAVAHRMLGSLTSVLSTDSGSYRYGMPEERVAVFVRLPKGQAAALDRLAEATGRRKQQVVSELLADRLPVGRVDRLLLARDAREGAAELQRRSQRWGLASVTAFWSSIAALREVRDAMPPAY